MIDYNAYTIYGNAIYDEPSKTLCTPYIRGVSEKLEKVCNALGIKTAFKPVKILWQTFMKVKTHLPEVKRRGVVY